VTSSPDSPAGGADPSTTADALGSPLEAVADMRATAKWIVAAAAAVGAVLLGGGPLAAVGKVHGVGHAALSFAGLTLAVLGVGWVIWHTSEALLPRSTTLAALEDPALHDLKQQVLNDPASFFGPFGTTVAELRHECGRNDRVAANVAVMLAREQDPARQRVLTHALEVARANAAMAHRRLRYLHELIHAWTVRAQLRRARIHIFAGAAVTALGAVLFLTAAGSAPAAAANAPTPAPSAAATGINVNSSAGRAALG
jgi:hypothetical protein